MVVLVLLLRNVVFALPGIPLPEFPVNGIQHVAFGGAPERGNEQVFGTIAGKTVDDQIRAADFQTGNNVIRVFFQGQGAETCLPVDIRQIRTLQHMEKLELDSVCAGVVYIADRFQHIFLCFAGKTQNHMDYGFQMPFFQILYGPVKAGEIVAPPDEGRRLFPGGLEAQLYPDRFLTVQLFQKIQNLGTQAVRAGGNGENGNFRTPEGFGKRLPQVFYGCIGVGVSLEVGNVFLYRAFSGQPLFSVGNLFRDREPGIGSEFTGAA